VPARQPARVREPAISVSATRLAWSCSARSEAWLEHCDGAESWTADDVCNASVTFPSRRAREDAVVEGVDLN